MEEVHLEWPTIVNAVKSLALVSSQYYNPEPRGIIAISRGGLIPAVLLSHCMNDAPIYSILARSYSKDNVQGELFVDIPDALRHFWDSFSPEDFLIIDDIYDTGATYNLVTRAFPGTPFLTIAVKGEKMPPRRFHSYLRCVNPTWIKFPWEGD